MPELIKDDSSYTLSAQVNYWLSYILDIPTELQTEAVWMMWSRYSIKVMGWGIFRLSSWELA